MARKKRILVVDGDVFLAHILGVRFQREGMVSLTADGLEEAWGQLSDFKPDLVLSGVELGADSGIDLLERVRQWEAESGHQTKFILLDRIKNPETYEQSQGKGADGYIAKTTSTFEDMMKYINRVLAS